jgi:Smr domain
MISPTSPPSQLDQNDLGRYESNYRRLHALAENNSQIGHKYKVLMNTVSRPHYQVPDDSNDDGYTIYPTSQFPGFVTWLRQESTHSPSLANSYRSQASQLALDKHNTPGRVGKNAIDLHGMYLKEVRGVLRNRIELARRGERDHLHVITGKGERVAEKQPENTHANPRSIFGGPYQNINSVESPVARGSPTMKLLSVILQLPFKPL